MLSAQHDLLTFGSSLRDSGGVSKVQTRAAKEVKRRRVSMTNEERKLMQFCLLQSAFSSEDDKIDETSWLTSTLMDLMLWRLATQYPSVHFLPTDFFHCFLESRSRARHQSHSHRVTQAIGFVDHAAESEFLVRDVLGRMIDYTSDRPILFAVNSGLIHWNLFRVQLTPFPELQLFEPMGCVRVPFYELFMLASVFSSYLFCGYLSALLV